MEFSVFRQVLIRALGHMQSIVEKRAALPILVNVKIEVGDDLILSATNVDLELVEHVAADITLSGKSTVPVQMLYDIVRKLPDDAEISFKQSGDLLVVSSGRAVFHLPTLSAENFPAMAGGNLSTKFQMTTGDLAHLINQTKFAIPTDDVRYHLGGIYFH
ncbi:MAG: DNA polymerase III subunit beta, partial [Alphaproteobacteria bacterium]|nr:DNA polymerase III subunit beta [Alphaproteobacteria bacterium]